MTKSSCLIYDEWPSIFIFFLSLREPVISTQKSVNVQHVVITGSITMHGNLLNLFLLSS